MNSPVSTQQAVQDRLAKRHRAERRFRFYGLAAIFVAALFLVVLLTSIITTSFGAFTQHRLKLPLTLEASLVDPVGDLSADSLRRGAYNQVIQRGLQSQFPSVEQRGQLRELYGLYSAVNAAGLLERVLKNRDLVGETLTVDFPISDHVDLYLKGESVSERVSTIYPELRFEVDGSQVMISADEGVFTDFISEIRTQARQRAVAYQAAADLAQLRLGQTLDRNEREILTAEAERARALAVIELNHADARDGADLTAQTASLFVRYGEGVIRVTRISAIGSEAQGEVVVPLPDTHGERAQLWIVDTPANVRSISDRQMVWARTLMDRGLVKHEFNARLFTHADSREPELAGVYGALLGSILTMVATMFLAVPIGVSAAIYLEEFAPKNRLTDFIEVNINNLAAVPSIVFGLLGLAIFINVFGLPRSAPLVGGMVLALMTLPTVIISSRAALKAVPDSIREAALGIGASKTQAVFHHVLPMAVPGILTGSIIGLAQAFGETAPLLMIGMVAFIADPPSFGLAGMTEPATVMPVQIYIWSTSAERAFEARTAAAILLLLVVMMVFNALAIYLRRRFERRW